MTPAFALWGGCASEVGRDASKGDICRAIRCIVKRRSLLAFQERQAVPRWMVFGHSTVRVCLAIVNAIARIGRVSSRACVSKLRKRLKVEVFSVFEVVPCFADAGG